jgi:hypothetical protein
VFIKHSGSEIIGNNATLKPGIDFSSVSSMMMETGNTAAVYSNTAVSIPIVAGSQTFTFLNASNLLSAGDMVRLEGGVNYSSGGAEYNNGHLAQIKSVVGNVVTVSNVPEISFTATRIYSYKTLSEVKIRSLNFDLDTKSVYGAIALTYCINSEIQGGRFIGTGTGQTAIRIDQNINGLVLNTEISGFSKFEGAGPTAYGIAVHGHNIVCRENRISDCKHSLTSSDCRYLSTGIVFEYNICRGLSMNNNTAPLDFHGNARGVARNNTVYSFALIGAQFRDGGIDVIDNTIFVNWEGASTIIRGIVFYEKYFGENKISGNKIYFTHASNPVSVEAIKVDVNNNGGTRNKNVSILSNYTNEGFYSWAASDGSLVIENNTFDSVYGDLTGTTNRPGVELADCSDFLVQGNTINNTHTSHNVAAFFVRNTCKRGTLQFNTVKLANNIPSTMFYLNGSDLKAIENVVVSDASFVNYINGYIAGSKVLLQGNKKSSTSGTYSDVGYTLLPTPDGFYENKTIQVSNGTLGEPYLCKKIGASRWEWVPADLNNKNSFYTRGSIGPGVDLNTLVLSGQYVQGSSSGNTTLLNYPIEACPAGIIHVFSPDPAFVSQEYHTIKNRKFTRFYSSSAWGLRKEFMLP